MSPARWGTVLLALAAGFAVLLLAPAATYALQLVTRILFAGIPLAVLLWLGGRDARAMFGPLNAHNIVVALLAALLAIVLSVTAALVLRQFTTVAPNSAALGMAAQSPQGLLVNLLSTAPQLLGEELLTILPFLALLQLATTRWGLGARAGIALAVASSTFIFAAAHLPTYDWNWAQCLGVIGSARVVLTLAFVLTRNLWVSTVAHILTDWTEFALVFSLAYHPTVP